MLHRFELQPEPALNLGRLKDMSDEIDSKGNEESRIVQSLGSSVSRRTLLGGAALAIGGAALAACSTSSTGGNAQASSGTASLLQTVQSRGQLNVTTSLLYPPEFYKDSSGKPAGYDINILNMLASDLKVKLNILDVPDNAANIANVQSGKADIVSAGLVNTPARSLVLNFTRGYVPYTQVVIVPVNSGSNSVADLNKAGKTITALTASTAFFRAQLLFPKATITPLAQDEALLSVATGKADACLIEIYLATPFIAQHSNVKLMANGAPVATEFGCWGIPAGDYLWWLYLNNWIAYNTDNSQIPGMYKNTIGLDWVQPS
jgi:ABC-type amino acid transport substrate-binding protein